MKIKVAMSVSKKNTTINFISVGGNFHAFITRATTITPWGLGITYRHI